MTVGRDDIARRAGAVVTRALVRASADLGISGTILARIVGVSESTISRMRAGTKEIPVPSKSYELALMLIRIHVALCRVCNGDRATMQTWFRSDNHRLGTSPLALVDSIPGLVRVVEYLESDTAAAAA